jgi:RNA polymerase sigma-70 factor (ECF subfamily)
MEAMTRPVSRDTSDTFAAAARGDEVAFARIVETHDDEMYRVCVAVSRDQTIAADAVQAAWAIAWRKLGSVREPERLRPWLVTIAVNEAKTLLQKRHRRSQVESPEKAPDRPGGHDPATDIASVDLRAALERLDSDDRALLAMRYVAGFNATELADAIGLSPPGTRARLQRLLARLRTELE